MFAVSVCQSVRPAISLSVTQLNSAAHAVCAAYLLQLLPNDFGLLLKFLKLIFKNLFLKLI